MATKVYTDAQFGVNGVDLSAYVQEVTLNYAAEMLDQTAMGQGTRNRLGGLKTWSFTAKFNDDFAAAGPSNTLWALVGADTDVQFRPINACSTVSNPYYFGFGVPEGLPQGGAVGSLAQVSVTFNSAGTISRTTACWGA